MKNALVIGSTCVDVIIRIDHLPKTEENLHPQSQRFAVGGCAYNAANILIRTGAPTTFVTPVGGRGVFGDFTRKALVALGVQDFVDLPDAENGCCYCFVENSGERTFMSIHGAEYTFDPAWMAPYAGKRFDYGYVCGLEIEESTGDALIDYLETAPIGTLIYAPGPRGARIPRKRTERLLALNPILHLNEGEALALSGESTLEAAMRTLFAQTQKAVIVTLGARGVCWLDDSGLQSVPAVPCAQIADTIGAGDAHIGAVLSGLCYGLTMRESLEMANRVSSAVVGTSGATLSDDALARATENLSSLPRA